MEVHISEAGEVVKKIVMAALYRLYGSLPSYCVMKPT